MADIDGKWSIDFMWDCWLWPEVGKAYYDGWHFYIAIGPLRITKSYMNEDR